MRYNNCRFHLSVILRMGEATVYDAWDSSRAVRLSILDPAAIGKTIRKVAVPMMPFVNLPRPESQDSGVCSGVGLAQAVGAPSEGNVERTAAQVIVISDGYETRFSCTSPSSDYFTPDRYVVSYPMLSLRPPFYHPEESHGPEHTLLIASWQDPEMLGQAVLNIAAMAGPPVNKGITSVFDLPPPKRRSALHRISEKGQVEDLPVRKPRNVDPRDTVGNTPLMLAAGAGSLDVTSQLLDWGANPELQDQRGRTSLHHAAARGNDAVIRALLAVEMDPNQTDRDGVTALHLAVAKGWSYAAAELIAGGASANAQDHLYSSTPLHLAARGNHQSLLPLLAGAGANLNASNEAGRTPLHVAAAYGHLESVKELIAAGADVDRRDYHGEAPMHRAAFYQHLGCMDALVQSGANPGTADHQGNTPLHVAATMNRERAVRLLLDAGANTEITNREGLTPLDLAIVNVHNVVNAFQGHLEGTFGTAYEHNAEAAETLLEHRASLDPIRIPVGERHALWPHLTPANLLLPSGDLNYAKLPGLSDAIKNQLPDEDKDGNRPLNDFMNSGTLLHDAVTKNTPHLIESLVKAGALPDTAIRNYMTPLHTAAGQGNRHMVDLLLKLGADLEAPISNARDGRYAPWVQMWNRKHPGQKFDERWLRIAPQMNTALDIAVLCEQVPMVRYLLDLGAVPMPYLIGRPPCFDSQMEAMAHHQEDYESYFWAYSNSPESQAMAEMFREFVDIPQPLNFH